ncbi:magnesium transporter [Gallaecimonas sp. GXIMD4217]|uniref:magnesium transporter n=1 Tax=Gallaecimonas sp. GXIMD4217 TaxID=3131927 RepID=UPI00311AEEF4
MTIAPLDSAIQQLNLSFLTDHPRKAARALERLTPPVAAGVLESQPPHATVLIWPYLGQGAAVALLVALARDRACQLLTRLDPALAAALLSRLQEQDRQALLEALPASQAGELQELMAYPADTAGRLMTPRVQTFEAGLSVGELVTQLRARGESRAENLYVVDENQLLLGHLDAKQLLLAEPDTPLGELMEEIRVTAQALDPKEDILKQLGSVKAERVPVLDVHGRLLGAITRDNLFQVVKEDLVTDIQTMVGASREERALSPSLFAVRKRLPWLQINLLTAFAAAAVVGAFEGIIAQFTALAILLPVAAGQSGNAGAQALAVTMRGLTLREITPRHWRQVLFKEMSTGLLNGIAIALTCALGVFVWSQSLGLSLIIAISMVISLVVAGSAGALVPVMLKRLGQDPAQSSSIVLTTVTDIAGFLSFLGVATLLSGMLSP